MSQGAQGGGVLPGPGLVEVDQHLIQEQGQAPEADDLVGSQDASNDGLINTPGEVAGSVAVLEVTVTGRGWQHC